MVHDRIVDGEAMVAVEGPRMSDEKVLEEAFEEFRTKLETARQAGSINAMRAAVEAYDRFAAVARSF